MNTALSPMVSEFETIEQENSYNEWLRAKVAASLANPRPAIPHDEVERRMAERFAKCARNGVSSKCYPCYGLKAQIPT
ncbi:stability determinant [Escherichia coli]|nr:stability determinant [Escherichia coli]